MITGKNAANAVGGKTARACDSCLCKRARWYCSADDAFLCQACDSSVHSANLLASRHERVRLAKVPNPSLVDSANLEPAWHHRVTKKARTPRSTKPIVKLMKDEKREKILDSLALVPEIDSEENSPHEDEDQLLYRVPILDPFFCDFSKEMESNFSTSLYDEACELDSTIKAFDLPSDMDLAEFAADVESLLGGGIDHKDPCGLHELGFLDSIEEGENSAIFDDCIIEGRKLVKVEDSITNNEFDYEAAEEEEEKAVMMGDCYKDEDVERKMLLRLDYEGVINAWDCKGCPWANGTRPDLNPNDCWPDFLGSYLEGSSQQWMGQVRHDGVGREARLMRYKEKRRTRLFSKKIRYQVRKLNADKRPRMKGRFVKRSSLSSSSSLTPPPPPFPNYHGR